MPTLGVRRRIVGEQGPDGNPAITFSDPPEPWEVYGWAPGDQTISEPNRDPVVVAWTVYAPPGGDPPAALDRVVIDGADYPVEGDPQDWTHGPWPHPTAGWVVKLRRLEG